MGGQFLILVDCSGVLFDTILCLCRDWGGGGGGGGGAKLRMREAMLRIK